MSPDALPADVPMPQPDPLLLDDLERDEGLRLKPYRDTVGKLTIGCGRNLDDVGISEAEARVLLANDVARVYLELDANLPWWREMTTTRQRVLANMCFNMGIGGLLTFANTLAAMHAGNYTGAAAKMLDSKWARQVGARAQRLAAMMAAGDTGGVA